VMLDTDTKSGTLRLASVARPGKDIQASTAEAEAAGTLTTLFSPAQVIGTLTELPHCHTAALTGTPLYVTADQAGKDEARWYRELGLNSIMIVPLMVGTGGTARQEDASEGFTNVLRGSSSDGSRCVGLAFVNYHNP